MINPLRLALAVLIGSILSSCDLNPAPEIAYLEVEDMQVIAKND